MVTPTATGDYTFRTFSAGQVQLSVNNQVVIDHWRQGWLPNEDIAHVSLTAGQSVPGAPDLAGRRHRQNHLACSGSRRSRTGPPRSGRKSATASTTTSSTARSSTPSSRATAASPERPPMMPQWAFGFWQCREHYKSAQEITDVLPGYRSRSAPIDNIVQDWQYWTEATWGSHEFDPTRYPDPVGMIKTIHDTYHAHFMISVWPKFYTGIANFTALNASAGYLYQPNLTADDEGLRRVSRSPSTTPSTPGARQLYWSQINTALFSKGVDAWWMDATEPDIVEGPFTSDRLADQHHPDAHEPHRARLGLAHAERLFAGEQPGRLRGTAHGGPQPARLHPHAQRFRRAAALLRRRPGRATSARPGPR